MFVKCIDAYGYQQIAYDDITISDVSSQNVDEAIEYMQDNIDFSEASVNDILLASNLLETSINNMDTDNLIAVFDFINTGL